MEEDYDATNTGRVFNLRGDAGPHKNQMLGRMATEHYEHDTHPEGILDIHYVETHPSYRGMGLGSQMIEHAKRHLNQTTGTRGTTTTASTGFTSEGMAYLHGKGHIQYGTMPSSVAGKVGWSKYDPGYEDDWV
jgi:GNAT superfamily N-acetyltransferase